MGLMKGRRAGLQREATDHCHQGHLAGSKGRYHPISLHSLKLDETCAFPSLPPVIIDH